MDEKQRALELAAWSAGKYPNAVENYMGKPNNTKCPFCESRHYLGNDERLCKRCGSYVLTECPFCAGPYAPDSRFFHCTHCGKDVRGFAEGEL